MAGKSLTASASKRPAASSKALVFHDNVQNFQKVRGVFQDTHDECFEAGGVVECIADGFGGFGDRDYVNAGRRARRATEVADARRRAGRPTNLRRGAGRPTITGYRDLKVNVKVTTDRCRGRREDPHTCEVVIHHKVMLNLSDEHDACKVYDFFRSFLLGARADDERRRARAHADPDVGDLDHGERGHEVARGPRGALERLTTFNHLMRAIGEFELAEMVQGRIVDLTIQTFGAGSIDHARAMEGLAMVLYAQEKYKEAEPIFRDSMRLKEERLSHNDPELGPLLSYMSLCLERQGNFEDAVGPSRRALEIREAQLGPDHPDVAKLLNTQANLHYAQGRYEHADPLYRRALHITERRMGEKHPDVATALNNLASLLYQTRQYVSVYGEAMQYERARHPRAPARPEHPDVATLVNNMAALLAAQKKAEAPLYERAMDIYAERSGRAPAFATALTNLATMAKHYGEVHLEVAAATTVLAAVLRNLHRFDEAKALYKKALKTREECAGKISRPVATSFNNLGHCHKCAGEFEEGVVAYKRALRIREKVQGNDSVPYAKSLAVAIIERSDGPDSTDLVRPLKDLAIALSKLGRNKEARENRRKSVAVHRAIAREGGGNHDGDVAPRDVHPATRAGATRRSCALALLKGGEELRLQALEGVAPHEAAAFSLELDAAAVAGAQHVGAADAVAVQVAAGGGAPRLTLHQTSAALEVDAAADAAPAAPADVARIARALGRSGDVCEETSTTTEIIIGLLVDEFGKLVDCDSPEVIRKVVALDQLKDGEFRGLDAVDLERIPDQREFEREAANLVVQMWADTKRSGDPDSVVTVHDRDKQIFLELKAWMERARASRRTRRCSPGASSTTPLQSLFNKAYVRRGQMSSAQIAGDIRRCTFTVETVEELERLKTMLEGALPATTRKAHLDAPARALHNDGRCGAGRARTRPTASSAALFQRAFPASTAAAWRSSRTASRPSDGRPQDLGVIINDANFKAWCEPMNQILWSGDVDPDAVQNVESLFVDVQDQGWGGEGLLVALVVELGPYLVCLASRGNRKERQLRDEGQPGIYLVDETGYNFGLLDKTVARGASRLHVVACGRLTDYGHSFTYCGLRMRLATLKAPARS
ncbi:hypothetical protein JL720_13953 [Aureococcus anophagefferens]|nr:hypothetical protein JL720_13953 [Aureococcus anophagefferens]